MNVLEIREIARDWVDANAASWPGFRAAHLVGGITAMDDLDPFPATKDVDLHLIFESDSPMVQPHGPIPNMLEVSVQGIPIEAGLKPVSDYATPEAILGNPELAYHFTVTSSLYDPDGWLSDLTREVVPRYADHRWVETRMQHEIQGLEGTIAMRPMAQELLGPSGELNLLGYSVAFLAGALSVAALEPPRIGGRLYGHIRRHLEARGRMDLYGRLLSMFGFSNLYAADVRDMLAETAELFDLAIERKVHPHPFEHKLNAHLRGYLVETSRELIDDGLHREAAGWILPYYLSTTDVLKTDGRPEERALATERQESFLIDRRFGTATDRAARFAEMTKLAGECFALCASMIAWNPAIRQPARDDTC